MCALHCCSPESAKTRKSKTKRRQITNKRAFYVRFVRFSVVKHLVTHVQFICYSFSSEDCVKRFLRSLPGLFVRFLLFFYDYIIIYCHNMLIQLTIYSLSISLCIFIFFFVSSHFLHHFFKHSLNFIFRDILFDFHMLCDTMWKDRTIATAKLLNKQKIEQNEEWKNVINN